MRKLLVLFAVVLATLPIWAATKVTVSQLDSMLAEMHSQNKRDEAAANKLKDLELTEQLAESAMNSLSEYEPGPQTIVQIRALALESAMLPPPPTDLPDVPPPDQATQKAIMSRAIDYVTQDFSHLPQFTADKTTVRYQNGEDIVRTSTGAGSQMAHSDLGFNPANQYMRYHGEHSTPVVVQGGVEIPTKAKSQGPVTLPMASKLFSISRMKV
jgi:hypothetical protein